MYLSIQQLANMNLLDIRKISKLRQNINPIIINTNTSHKGEKTAQGANEGKRQTHQETH